MDTEWVDRSNRAAAALLAASPLLTLTADDYNAVVELLASAWRQGHIDGLNRAEAVIRGTVDDGNV